VGGLRATAIDKNCPVFSTNSSHRRSTKVGLLIGVIVVLSIDGVVAFARHNTAKPVSVDEAIQKFRSHTLQTTTPTPTPRATPTGFNNQPGHPAVPGASPLSASTPGAVATNPLSTPSQAPSATRHHRPGTSPAPTGTSRPVALPPTGVYSYRTSGEEEVGIPGGHRTLPATTTITVESTGCGESEEWDASTQHSETRVLCLDNGAVRLDSFTSKISFFGFGSTNTYDCGPDAVVYSPDTKLGEPLSFTCTSDNGAARQTLTEIGYRHIVVGGTRVRVLHVHVDTVLTGSNSGTSRQDLWVTTGTSIPVRTDVHTDATSEGAHYTSNYRLELTDLEPAR
jgi:hypothetical protein